MPLRIWVPELPVHQPPLIRKNLEALYLIDAASLYLLAGNTWEEQITGIGIVYNYQFTLKDYFEPFYFWQLCYQCGFPVTSGHSTPSKQKFIHYHCLLFTRIYGLFKAWRSFKMTQFVLSLDVLSQSENEFKSYGWRTVLGTIMVPKSIKRGLYVEFEKWVVLLWSKRQIFSKKWVVFLQSKGRCYIAPKGRCYSHPPVTKYRSPCSL